MNNFLLACSCNNIVSRFIMPGRELEAISRTACFSIECKAYLLPVTSPMLVATHYVPFAIVQPFSSITTQVKPHDHLSDGMKKKPSPSFHDYMRLQPQITCYQCSLPRSLKSSTRMISSMRLSGVRLIILCMVRRREVQPSLWNGIMMLVFGSLSRYILCLQLGERGEEKDVQCNAVSTDHAAVYSGFYRQ